MLQHKNHFVFAKVYTKNHIWGYFKVLFKNVYVIFDTQFCASCFAGIYKNNIIFLKLDDFYCRIVGLKLHKMMTWPDI